LSFRWLLPAPRLAAGAAAFAVAGRLVRVDPRGPGLGQQVQADSNNRFRPRRLPPPARVFNQYD
jgi:hypothetical protein